MRYLLFAASLIAVRLAPASAVPQEGVGSAENNFAAESSVDSLAYDAEQIDPDTAADIEAVVESDHDLELTITRRGAEEEDGGATADTERSTAITTSDVATPYGYTGPIAIGEAAINAFIDCNGEYTYMGFQIFKPPTFDIQLCAKACSETTA